MPRSPLRPSAAPRSRALRALTLAAPFATALAAACATAGGGGAAGPAQPAAGAAGSAAGQPTQPAPWAVRTKEPVDLWLHGMALLLDDTSRVPIFRRGYREEMRTLRSRTQVFTQLDAERDRLRARLAERPALALNAQFAALPFDSWEEMRTGIEALVATGGDPRRAPDQQRAAMVAFLAGTFATAADREWARIYAAALDDESRRFFHQHWLEQQRARSVVLAAADSTWTRAVRPRLERFLRNSQQPRGTLYLALPLGGEGRTQGGSEGTLVAVGLPPAGGDAAEPSYTAVHELAGSLAGSAVADNVTPAEQRSGVADRYVSAAQVRGGLLVLQRLAPDLAPGYARFYLRQAGVAVGADPAAALLAAFPLPAPIAESLGRQLETLLGGI